MSEAVAVMGRYIEHLIRVAGQGAVPLQIQFRGDITGPKSGAVRPLAEFPGLYQMLTQARMGVEDGPVMQIEVTFAAEEIQWVIYSSAASNLVEDRSGGPRGGGGLQIQ